MTAGDWAHVTYVFDVNTGVTWYINGVKDSFKDINEKESRGPQQPGCFPVNIGAKNTGGHYPIDAVVDDMKYMFSAVTAEGNLLCVQFRIHGDK